MNTCPSGSRRSPSSTSAYKNPELLGATIRATLRVCGSFNMALGSPDLLQGAGIHDGDAVPEVDGFLRIGHCAH